MLSLAILFVAGICGCDGAADLSSTPLPQTQNTYLEGDFAFTISPDDRWMLFYQRVPPDQNMPLPVDAELRILNLRTGELHQFDREPHVHPKSTSCWSADSRFYLIGRHALVFDDDQIPRFTDELVRLSHNQPREPERWRVPEEDVTLSVDGHCSDCYDGLFDYEFMQSVVGAEHLHRQQTFFKNIVSPDRDMVFYQQGSRSSTVRVYAKSVGDGTDRLLATHRGDCVNAIKMRQSPDGRFLAYQLAEGCRFAEPNRLYIIDLQQDKQWTTASHDVFGIMHWTSGSSRLYFAKRNSMQSPLFVHYVDVPRNDDADVQDDARGGQTDEGEDQR